MKGYTLCGQHLKLLKCVLVLK